MLLMFGLLLIFAGFTGLVIFLTAIAGIIAEGVSETPVPDSSGQLESMRDSESSCCSDRI
jgi:hypothetical protein